MGTLIFVLSLAAFAVAGVAFLAAGCYDGLRDLWNRL